MIRKTCLVLFLILILVSANFWAEEKRANARLREGQTIVVDDKEIEVVDYSYGKKEVTLEIEGEKYILKEGESLDVGFEIRFIEKTKEGFAFYISALPYFDELNEVMLKTGESIHIKEHEVVVTDTNLSEGKAVIIFDDERFFIPIYGKLKSEDLEIWLFGIYYTTSSTSIDLGYRYLYKDIENNTFPENVFRVPKTKEATCTVVVGRNAAEEDHEIADKIAESLKCKVLYDDEIEESHKKNYNLILVGGPSPPCGKTDPANKITYELVEKGIVKEEYWITGNGSKKGFTYFKDPWGYGKDVIVVAGSDREYTYITGEELIEILSE